MFVVADCIITVYFAGLTLLITSAINYIAAQPSAPGAGRRWRGANRDTPQPQRFSVLGDTLVRDRQGALNKVHPTTLMHWALQEHLLYSQRSHQNASWFWSLLLAQAEPRFLGSLK